MFHRKSLQFILNNAHQTALRFPLVLLSSLFFTSYSIYMIYIETNYKTEYKDLIDMILFFTLSLGISLSFAVSLFLEAKNKTSPLFKAFGGVFVFTFLLVFYLIYRNDNSAIFYVKYIQTALGTHLLVTFVGFLRKDSDASFWQTNLYLFNRILTSSIYALTLYGGISLSLITIDVLLVDMPGEVYLYLCAISFGIFQTWHFLAGTPKNILMPEEFYPKALKVFVQYMLIPLTSLYMVILYIYMLKILITWNLPQGYVGWLVSAVSILGVFNLLLIDPAKNQIENQWIKVYSKYFYLLVLPLLLMLFTALGTRIHEYGFTENRVFLMVLGFNLFFLSFYFLFSRNKRLIAIPVSLFIMNLLTLWSPISAYNISYRSQFNRLVHHLKEINAYDGSKAIATNKNVPFKVRKDISSIFDYLIGNHHLDLIKLGYPRNTALEVKEKIENRSYYSEESTRIAMKHLNLDYVSKWQQEDYVRSSFNSKDPLILIEGYQSMLEYNTYNTNKIKFNNKEIVFHYDHSVSQIKAYASTDSEQKTLFFFDLEKLVSSIQKDKMKSGNGKEMPSSLEIENKYLFIQNNKEPKIVLFIRSLSFEKKPDGKYYISNANGYIFIR